MTKSDLEHLLEVSRKRMNEFIDAIAARPDAASVLGWRPGPGRAHLAWQFMHVGATDDRHLNVRMRGGQPVSPEFVRRFAGGSSVDDEIPSIETIREYLTERRRDMIAHLHRLNEADLSAKPAADAPWVYEEWFTVLAIHESHHHGQAHLTYNLYRALHDPTAPKVGR
jgi:hypothetical protein